MPSGGDHSVLRKPALLCRSPDSSMYIYQMVGGKKTLFNSCERIFYSFGPLLSQTVRYVAQVGTCIGS
jgi:hypothetical protein